jgi:hypothetical protein
LSLRVAIGRCIDGVDSEGDFSSCLLPGWEAREAR